MSDEYEVTITLNEEQHRIATKMAREMGLSIDGLVRSVVSAVLMSNLHCRDDPARLRMGWTTLSDGKAIDG